MTIVFDPLVFGLFGFLPAAMFLFFLGLFVGIFLRCQTEKRKFLKLKNQSNQMKRQVARLKQSLSGLRAYLDVHRMWTSQYDKLLREEH